MCVCVLFAHLSTFAINTSFLYKEYKKYTLCSDFLFLCIFLFSLPYFLFCVVFFYMLAATLFTFSPFYELLFLLLLCVLLCSFLMVSSASFVISSSIYDFDRNRSFPRSHFRYGLLYGSFVFALLRDVTFH